MVDIPMRSSAPVTRQTVLSINERKVEGQKQHEPSLRSTTRHLRQYQTHPHRRQTFTSTGTYGAKGQKTPLENSGKLTSIKACLGWNVKNPACDVDVSAFLLGSSGKVIGDSWFVFLRQTESPDHSTVFHADGGADREIISVDFTRLDPSVARIVFVLTINEAFEKNLNFGMLEDAYIRIMDPAGTELVSFKMDEYYTNVTSMMIGELYLHNGAWKFNAIGNGVAKDLAGLCGLYGVQVI